MTLMRISSLMLALALASLTALAQEKPAAAQPAPPQENAPAQSTPASDQNTPAAKVDHAASYYHFGLAHMYEEMMAMYGRSEYANKAIEEYRLAIAADPSSEYLNAALADLYNRTGRIRDAVLEAQEIIQRDPNNLEAHKLLGRIYLRSLSDPQSGGSREVLKLAIEQYEAAVRIDPKNADNYLLLGRLYSLNKDLVKAESTFKQALKVDPNSDEAIINLAYLYTDEGDTQRAQEMLNSLPEASRTAKIYSAMGATYERQKDYKNAVAAYQRALVLDKGNLDAMRGLAQNLANDNQLDAALTEYKALQDADPQDPQPAVEMSKLYRRMGKLDLAMESLKKAEPFAQDSLALEVAYNEALLLEAQGKFDEAASVFQKLIARTTSPDGKYTSGERSNRALFLSRLGNLYRQSGRPQLAIETFRKIVDLGGEEAARGYQEIIDTYREQKQWPDAARTAQEAVKKLPEDRGLKLTLALQLSDDGKPEEGIHIAKSTLKGDSGDRETYISLSQIYARLKRWKEAEDAVSEADKLATRPEEKEYVQYFRGALYERQKKYDLAEQAFRQVLQQDPNNSTTLNYLGYMLADHNMRLEEALGMIKRAVELEPQNGAFLDSLGWVYFKLGNFDQAEENLRRAAEKTPNDATIQDHLGELYAKTGKLKLAAMHWERALDEWNKSMAADVDQQDVSRVQKKLESTKVKLAQQNNSR
ncbi:MAG TPA: tetratricopeptide repeat protein [Candidatus Angelobacter sp.]|nr:tetratricopeptide repeat protein [Candidatus Angelobacter sp.]